VRSALIESGLCDSNGCTTGGKEGNEIEIEGWIGGRIGISISNGVGLERIEDDDEEEGVEAFLKWTVLYGRRNEDDEEDELNLDEMWNVRWMVIFLCRRRQRMPHALQRSTDRLPPYLHCDVEVVEHVRQLRLRSLLLAFISKNIYVYMRIWREEWGMRFYIANFVCGFVGERTKRAVLYCTLRTGRYIPTCIRNAYLQTFDRCINHQLF